MISRNSLSICSRWLPFVLTTLILAGSASAQSEYGEIVGTVRDVTDAVVQEASVTVRNLERNTERHTQTDNQGNYLFTALLPGHYEVSATSEGFKTVIADDVTLQIANRLRVNLTLEPGAVTEQVDVVATAPLLETDTSSRGQVVTGHLIRELPLNKRDYTQLALLVPGVNREPRHRLGGAMNINGNRALQNNFLLDGADNNSHATSYRGERVDVIRPSVDAVAEFKVMTNSYSAEYGRSAGAVVNVAIKSGTNEFHGAAWEFFRNDKLDVPGWTANRFGLEKPKLRFNTFGANLGGPIVKNKAFFFGNYEGERERNGQTYVRTVAPAFLQAGDFSQVGPRDPRDLRETPLQPGTNEPFPNLVIPQSLWDPVTRTILDEPNFPLPNVQTDRIGNNYSVVRTDEIRSDKFDARYDHHFGDAVRLFGRLSYSDLVRFRPGPFDGFVEGATNDAFGTTDTKAWNIIGGPNVTFSPTTIGEFRAGFTRLEANVFPVNFGSPGVTELLGIPNIPNQEDINGGWPKLRVSGLSDFGRHTSTPQFQTPDVYLYKGTVSFLRGAHSIKVGTDNLHIFTPVLDVSAPVGRFSFRRNVFTQNAWGDFLLGLPRDVRMTTPTVINNRQRIHQFFVQDDYRVASNLTLNLGVRYEYGAPITEKFDRLANFNPSTGERSFANPDGDLAERALVEPDRNNWAPRVGLAWTAGPGMVVRAAYGIFYNHTNRQGREGLLGMNNPFVVDLERRQLSSTTNPISLSSGPPPDFLENVALTDQINRANDPTLRSAYIQQWNFTLQFQPWQSWLFEIGYVGNRGNKLTRFFDVNQALEPGPPDLLQLRRPFHEFGEIQYMDSGGTSNYHGLQTRIERRFSSGLSLLQSFTYSRALENVGAWGEEQSGGGRRPQNAYDFANEYGLAGTNSKLRSVTNWVWELPIGRGKRYLSNANPVADAILGGWQVSGIWTMQSGLPVNIRSNECGPRCQMGGQRRQRADVVPGVDRRLDNPTPEMWINVDAFAEPEGPFGTASRNSTYGPGLIQWDLSAMKNFQLTERFRMQFRTEFFNAFNQTNLDRFNNNVSSGAFGQISSALDGRSIQFGLKLYW